MLERRRCGITLDRRSGIDRRKAYNLDYSLSGKPERRNHRERRSLEERRYGWIPLSQGCSVFIGDLRDLSPRRRKG